MTSETAPAVLPARRQDLVEREVDGARLVYGRGAGPHLLDPLGAALFDSLDGAGARDELVEDLAAALEEPLDTAERGLAAFLADVGVRGLLVSDPPGSPRSPAAAGLDAAGPTGWRYPVVPPSP